MSADPILRFMEYLDAALETPIARYYDTLAAPLNVPGIVRHLAEVARERVALYQAEQAMRRVLYGLHFHAAQLGSPGQLDSQQMAYVNRVIQEQEQYLAGFMRALPGLSRAQALARARLYGASIVQMLSQMAAWGLPTLPIYPGDARLACSHEVRACKCHLKITPHGRGNYDVYWILNPEAEHCEDCSYYAATWNPLVIKAGRIVAKQSISARTFKTIYRMAHGAFSYDQ